jgi:hypothetical protein
MAQLPWESIAGGAAGWISTFVQTAEEKENLQHQKELAWNQYELGKAYSDQQYGINRTEAHTNLAIQEQRLGQDVDSFTDQFNTGLLAQAYGIQNAQIQAASGIGASRAAEGMGGTRGNGANELMRAYEQTGLDRTIGLQYRQNDQALSGMVTQANRGMQDIGRERASWDPGGYRYESKAAQDSYNLKMAELGQNEFDYQSAQLDKNMWWNGFYNSVVGSLGGLQMYQSRTAAANVSGGGGGADQAAVNSAFNTSYSRFSAGAGSGFDTFNYGLNPSPLYTPKPVDRLNMDFWS